MKYLLLALTLTGCVADPCPVAEVGKRWKSDHDALIAISRNLVAGLEKCTDHLNACSAMLHAVNERDRQRLGVAR